jgi:thioredoxin-related protein
MKYFFCLIICFCTSFDITAQPGNDSLAWYSNVNEAYEASRSTNRPIFAFFTGSDWCAWCHKLQLDVFSKPEFIQWAHSHVVLLELDYPNRKKLPTAIVQQNQALQQFFQVQGFPTIWIFSMSEDTELKKFVITPHGVLGYPKNPVKGKEQVKFLEDANAVLTKKQS